MKRRTRIALIIAAAVVVIFVVGIGLAVTFINPNAFKPEIEAAALQATGKELSLQGDLSLSFFPGLRLEAGPAELKDSPSFGSESFARVEKISASVDLLPLFSGRAEVRAITISGLRLKLAVNDKGAVNWAMPQKPKAATDPAPKPAPEPSPKPGGGKSAQAALSAIALDSLVIEDTLVVYTDMRSKDSMRVAVPSFTLNSLKVGQKTTMKAEVAYTGPLARPVTLALDADFVLPASFVEGLTFNAKGKLDDTPFSCSGTAALPETADGQLFSLKSDITVGALDLDKYTAAMGSAKQAPPAAQKDATREKTGGKAPSGDEGLRTLLRTIFLDLRIAMESLTVAKVPVKNIKASIKSDQGLLVAKPVTMTVAEGPVTLEASVDARGKDIRSRVTGDWKAAKVGSLLQAATGKTSLTGDLDASWGLNLTGTAWPEAAKTLEGKASANFTNGAMQGFKLIPSGIPGLPAHTMNLTNLRGSGTWNIAKGVAHNNDLIAKAVGLDAVGTGKIDIPDQSLFYNVTVELPTLPELPNLTVLPVVISGKFDSVSYGIDQPALLRDTAKSILDPTTKAGQGIQRGIGKIFGR
ncbi:exported hypothetical protein [uncultured delta proteobacterium]|uniref:AsmA domain-containing protein n=1 Tax=uncultured delta proteobacterium TaxID=34034 RepID=A0A212JE82_9DELT|nr:exported hypothetical protein [uncultured delta proteobacterium]